MNVPFGGLYSVANTTIFYAPAAGAAYTTGWTVDPVSRHGEASIVPTAASGKLTMAAGVYELVFEGSIYGPAASGGELTSGDTTGEIAAKFYVADAAVTGAVSKGEDVTDGVITFLSLSKVVEITEAQVEAATNYAQVYLFGSDSQGNDLIVTDARFYAKRLN